MSRYVFVPLTDELLYDHPELITGPIRPYQSGEECHHWLSVEINPSDIDTHPNVVPLRPRQNTDQSRKPDATRIGRDTEPTGVSEKELPTLKKAVRGKAH